MRKLLPHIALITIALVGVGAFLVPHAAYAFDPLDITTWGADIMYGLVGKFFWFILVPATGWLLWLVGQMIDAATIVSLTPDFFDSSAISTSWSIIRDLCNMLFIFVLIWAGLRTILSIGNAAAVRKTITGVIIAALFINFSLFIGKAIIDVSNIGTAWFVQGIENIGNTTSVSDAVHAILQMNKLATNNNYGGDNASFTLQAFVTGLALFVINCVAIYVFFSVAFFLIARIVAFIFLLITSPLGFVSWLEIPQLTKYSNNWWEEMRNQALMAPMFFLMLYITLYLVDQINTLIFSSNAATVQDSTGGSSFAPANYVMFAIIIMMLLKCLETAKEYSGNLGNALAGYLKSATGIALGGVTAGFGALGRQTFGRGAFTYMQNKEAMGALTAKASQSGFRGFVARRQVELLNKGATSSYDARATKAGAGMLGAFEPKLKIAGVNLDASKVGKVEGAGFKGGVEDLKDTEKKWMDKYLGKGKAGASNRIQYAKAMRSSWKNEYLLNPGTAGKGYKGAFGDLADEAGKEYVKADTETAQREAQGIKNQIIDEQISMEVLKKAAKTDNVGAMNKALNMETARINAAEKKFTEDKDNKLAYNRYLKEEAERTVADKGLMDPEGQKAFEESERLDKEFAEATKNMTGAEKKEIAGDKDGKIKKVREFEGYLKDHREKIESAKNENSIAAKKAMIEVVNKHTKEERIGTPSENWDKDSGTFKKQGKGLSEELRKKKKDAQDKKREQDILEGKTPKKKGKNEEPRQDEKESEAGEDEDEK